MAKVKTTQIGIASATRKVVRTFRRKKKRKITARRPPTIPALRSWPEALAHVDRGVAVDAGLEALRLWHRLDGRELGLGGVGHREEVGGGGLVDPYGQGLGAVEEVELLLAREAVAHLGHVADGQPGGVQGLAADLVEGVVLADAPHHETPGALLDVPPGLGDVGGAQGLGDLTHVEAVGLEARGDQVDPHLGLLHPPDLHLRDPLLTLQATLDHLFDEVLHPVPGPVRGHVEAQDREVLALEASDPDLTQVGGEEVTHPVDPVPHLDRGQVHVGPVLELDADAAFPGRGPGAQGLDSLDGPQGVLERAHDPPLGLLR